MQVRAKIALLAGPFHRSHHLAVYNKGPDIAALALPDELLHQHVHLEAVEGVEHRLCRLFGLGQHHPDALGAFEQLDDQRRPAHHPDQIVFVAGRPGKAGIRHAHTCSRQDLHAPQLVARAHNGLRLHSRKHVHHLELPNNGAAVKGDGCTNAGDHGIDVIQQFPVVMNHGLRLFDKHIALQRVDYAYMVPALNGRFHQPARGVKVRITGEDNNVHSSERLISISLEFYGFLILLVEIDSCLHLVAIAGGVNL